MRAHSTAIATAIVLAACAAPDASEPRVRWVVPPLFEPHSFRIETVMFDVPKELAVEFGPAPMESDSLIGFRIDETGRREALEALARNDRRAVRTPRHDVVVRSGYTQSVAAGAAGAAASDSVSLLVGAKVSDSWAPVDFTLRTEWATRDGRTIASAQGSTPLPYDHWIQSFCVPPLEGEPERAVYGFFRVEPIFDECSALATLDPGDGIASDVGRLLNVGSVPIRFCVAGDRVPRRIELGEDGAAWWQGDGRTLDVTLGERARFRCIGARNHVRASARGGELAFAGAANTCTIVADGAGGTRFTSEPKQRGELNAIDLAGEEGNELVGPWRPLLDPVDTGG